MSEVFPESTDRSMNRLRKYALPPLALFLSTAALAGCAIGGSSDKHEKLTVPGLTSHKLGQGDESFALRVRPAKREGPGPHHLVIGVNMSCAKSGHESTSVTVEGAVKDFETQVCGDPQFDTIDIPPSDPLYTSDEITIHVNASKPSLKWVVGAATKR